MHVDEFIKMHASERSAKYSLLTPFRDAIIKLKNEGVMERNILKFLALNNVAVNQSTLHRFVKRHAEIEPQKKRTNIGARQRPTVPAAGPQSEPRKPVDSSKPSRVPDHINVDELLSKS